MSRRLQRLISFILAMILTLSSVDTAFATVNALSEAGGNHTTTTTYDVANTTAQNATGYKLRLVFLPIEGIEDAKTEEERNEMIDDAWDAANPEDATQIGKTIYLTDSQSLGAGIELGFRYDGFYYGLGTKANNDKRLSSTGVPDLDTISSSRIVTPTQVNSVMSSLKLSNWGNTSEVKYSDSSMNMDSTIPIKIGENQHNSDTLYSYLVTDRTTEDLASDTEVTGTSYANANLAGLINYIATEAGTRTDQFIYFARIVDKNGNVNNYSDLIPDNANCFESGRYDGNYGEIRLIIEPYWGVHTELKGNRVVAYTLRDFAYLYEYGGGYEQVTKDQIVYVRDLGYTTRLKSNDIWGLVTTDKADWLGQSAGTIAQNINSNLGGGLAFVTSDMVYMPPKTQETYIGSVSHIFLPGSLSDSQTEIKTASMEYLGPKADETGTSNAMTDAATNIGRALAGETIDSANNIFNGNYDLTQSLILNGTIKIPGISPSSTITTGSYQTTNAYAANNQSKLIDALEAALDEYTDDESAVRDGIIEVIKEYLGIDLSDTSNTSNTINMQDLNLVIYCLAHYQQDGLEATSGDTSDALANGANRWKQILAYQAMLENEASSQYIQESKGWVGPLSITWDDIANYAEKSGITIK